MITRCLTALALVCFSSGYAVAQPSPPPPPPGPNGAGGPGPWTTPPETTVRSGLMFGVGVGVGSLVADCDDCSDTFEAGGIDARIGYMITPRLAIMLDVWGMAHREDFLTVYQNINTIAARWWVTPALWLQGGVGNANAGYEWDGIFVNVEDRTEKTAGVMFGFGYEFHVKPHFAIDVSFRYGTGFYDTTVGNDYVIEGHSAQLGVGFNWF